MKVPAKSYITDYDLLTAVRELGKEFRTSLDVPSLQLSQVQKAQVALAKIALQLKWWHVTRVTPVSSDAFEFLAEQLAKNGKILDSETCCAHEIYAVKELRKAGIIGITVGGYIECRV